MQVKERLTRSFVYAVIIASVAGLLGAILMLVMDARYSKALELNGFIQGDLGQYNSYLNKGGAFVRDIIVLTDEAEIATAQENLKNADDQVDYYYGLFVDKLETEEEHQLTALIDEKYPQYNFKKHKGYPTKNHMDAVRKYGPAPIYRMSFLKFLDK